jgi:hypothetical protein
MTEGHSYSFLGLCSLENLSFACFLRGLFEGSVVMSCICVVHLNRLIY